MTKNGYRTLDDSICHIFNMTCLKWADVFRFSLLVLLAAWPMRISEHRSVDDRHIYERVDILYICVPLTQK